MRLIGCGSFGEVQEARWRGISVAVKKMHRNRISDANLESFTRAAQLELSLRPHPNVVRLLGLAWSIQEASVMLVMELCDDSLAKALTAASMKWATQKMRLLRDLALGVEFLHAQGVIHRDIKPGNVLVDATRSSAKVADFGLSRFEVHDRTMTGEVGTLLFAAPEVLSVARYVT